MIQLYPILFSLIVFQLYQEKGTLASDTKSAKYEWNIADLLQEKSSDIEISGSPKLIDSPYGKAVSFDGISDALFINEMPLRSLREFTVEMIFKPDTSSPFEQRILHIGEVSEDRMLLEIRAVGDQWYFDGFISSSVNSLALIDENKTHPLGQWYHVALVVAPNRMTTYVNGQQELSEPFIYSPIQNGQTSIGVRQNKRSWFKGSIYKILITPQTLNPNQFLTSKK
ncbi:MAG: LamG domain-containing protein [Cyclobacteriaceae bacterium]